MVLNWYSNLVHTTKMSEKMYFLNPLFLVLLSSNALYALDQTKAGNLLIPKSEQSKGEEKEIMQIIFLRFWKNITLKLHCLFKNHKTVWVERHL